MWDREKASMTVHTVRACISAATPPADRRDPLPPLRVFAVSSGAALTASLTMPPSSCRPGMAHNGERWQNPQACHAALNRTYA